MATRRGQNTKSYFKISIDGVEISGFTKVQGLSTSIEVLEKSNKQKSIKEKLPGESAAGNVILFKKRTREQSFWNWLKTTQKGKLEKKNVTIEVVYRNKPLRGWHLINCWPCRWSISEITDDSMDTIEEIELAVDEVELL